MPATAESPRSGQRRRDPEDPLERSGPAHMAPSHDHVIAAARVRQLLELATEHADWAVHDHALLLRGIASGRISTSEMV